MRVEKKSYCIKEVKSATKKEKMFIERKKQDAK